MPYGRKIRRFTRTRTTRRRRVPKGRKSVANVYKRYRPHPTSLAVRSKWANPLARAATFRFRYADSGFTMSTFAAGSYVSYYKFSGNSPYDPDATGVGVQPYGWDNIASASNYPYYQVMGSSCKAILYLNAACHQGTFTIVPMRTSTPNYSDRNDLRVIPGSKQRQVSTDTRNPVVLKSYTSTRRICSGFNTSGKWLEESFTAAYNANPTTRWYWHVYFDTSGNSVEAIAYMDVEITYYVKLFRTDDDNEG